jgi:hypothetical protein
MSSNPDPSPGQPNHRLKSRNPLEPLPPSPSMLMSCLIVFIVSTFFHGYQRSPLGFKWKTLLFRGFFSLPSSSSPFSAFSVYYFWCSGAFRMQQKQYFECFMSRNRSSKAFSPVSRSTYKQSAAVYLIKCSFLLLLHLPVCIALKQQLCRTS